MRSSWWDSARLDYASTEIWTDLNRFASQSFSQSSNQTLKKLDGSWQTDTAVSLDHSNDSTHLELSKSCFVILATSLWRWMLSALSSQGIWIGTWIVLSDADTPFRWPTTNVYSILQRTCQSEDGRQNPTLDTNDHAYKSRFSIIEALGVWPVFGMWHRTEEKDRRVLYGE